MSLQINLNSFAFSVHNRMDIQIPLFERIMPLPLDFRSKEQVEKTIQKNRNIQ